MDGIFCIDKAAGMTSHDVTAAVRRLAHQKRVGHAGTLDPAATGVLPICLGEATRVAEYLSDGGKAYRATIHFGRETDTYDSEGRTTAEAPVTIDEDDIRAALPSFLGTQPQIPPAFSAIKRAGQPSYKLARAGQEIALEARLVSIFALTVVSFQSPDLVLDVECGKGTYIRSLAFDLGRKLGPGAYLAALIRTRNGPFTLAESLTLDTLELALHDGSWPDYLYAPDEALLERRAAVLGELNEWRLCHGLPLNLPVAGQRTSLPSPGDQDQAELLRAYSLDGRFLGILRWVDERSSWQPHKVLAGSTL
jgi:tRNA pseudouridine55 synthase